MSIRNARFRRASALPVGWLRWSLRAGRAVGFWLAVALPLAYLPLVVAAPAPFWDLQVLGAIVLGNLLAIVVGHGHEPSLARMVVPGCRRD